MKRLVRSKWVASLGGNYFFTVLVEDDLVGTEGTHAQVFNLPLRYASAYIVSAGFCSPSKRGRKAYIVEMRSAEEKILSAQFRLACVLHDTGLTIKEKSAYCAPYGIHASGYARTYAMSRGHVTLQGGFVTAAVIAFGARPRRR